MKHLLAFISVFIFVSSLPQTRPIQPTDLAGQWQGTVTSEFKGASAQGSIFLQFLGDQRVLITTTKEDQGTFSVESDSITITLKDAGEDPIKLKNVRLTGGALSAQLVVTSDPPGMSNLIQLSKVNSPARRSRAQETPKICADLALPDTVVKLFEKYEIDCPIRLPPNASYYEVAFYRSLLSEVVREITGQRYDVAYVNGEFSIKVPNLSRAEDVHNIVVPLLETANIFRIEIEGAPRCPPPLRCSLALLPIRELKSEYVSNGQVDLDLVWSRVIQIAESKNVRFAPPTRETTGRSAQAAEASPVAKNEHGIFYEKISVQLTDEYASDLSRRGTYIRLFIKSEIWRKNASSVKRAMKIEDQCSTETSRSFSYICSDKPIMDEILKAISTATTWGP